MIGSNVFGQVQQYQQTAGDVYGRMAQGQIPTLAGANISQYMSPYTEQVIQRGEADIARQREQALNQLGSQATRAGAFGGSRHGIAEGQAYGEYGRMAADLAARQREQAFNQAMQAAQYDVTAQRAAEQQGAAGLTGLGQTMFGQGMRGLEQQQQQAQFARRQQQMLLDAARQQTLANLGYPAAALETGTGLLSRYPSQSEIQRGQMGLVDILAGVGSLPSFPSIF